ncbi:MAG: pseudouridine synthase [Vicinamibacterales bacterium]|jgi:pseudouridine synthase|nr:pseudouridine synthase [Acidobacteriota bacterium]MDP6374033.1 pseudouridine synthase [Vicinamibacterales bacterium]MDP6610621.1 pseudouridine synthase [Vicinamibacterales bacterium]HAK56788.1 pseudouridine synthase [Acidobacteriota bacterium]|tara:strand:+ start:648 stop:1409 length:762 start_codon:yes stop_codon:yes gene_type:complete
MSPAIRLQKLLSAAGVSSRRAAERLMESGRVTVNGEVANTLGMRADPEVDDVRVDGRRVARSTRRRYLLLHKPRGYVTTRSDPQGRRTVLDLLTRVRDYVYPVGRLDYESEGLLLLTNDGELAARLTHPRHAVERVYEARVRGVPTVERLARLRRGVHVDGRRTAPASVRILRRFRSAQGGEALLTIGLREGRHRQVRKMCEAIGHPVVRLRRVQIGPLRDRALKVGEYRELSRREVDALRRASDGSSKSASR